MSLIRTTYGGLFDLMARQGNKLKGEIRTAEEQAITGLKVNRPSDAPGQITQINRLRETIADQQLYVDNAVSAQTWIGSMDQVLGEAESVLTRAREIAMQMANESYNEDDLAAAAIELEGLQEQFLNLANSDVGGRYLFAGADYRTVPFTDISGTYVASSDAPSTLVGDDTYVDTGLVGSDVFSDGFAALADLTSALQDGDHDAVSASLTALDDGRQQVIHEWEAVGFAFSRVEDAMSAAEGMEAVLTESLNGLVVADPEEAYTRLIETRTSYEAALQVASSGFDLSLFKFI